MRNLHSIATCSRAAAVALALGVGLAAVHALVACRPWAREGSSFRAPGANLIIISIDTLRADRLGSYGYDRDTSPTLDALAARGVRFEKVIAETSWTAPSHMTLLTGLHPATHGVTHERRLPDGVVTLAQVLRQHGYFTYANTGGGYVSRSFDFDRGFAVFEQARKTFAVTQSRARKQLETLPPHTPFFFFLHTYDVHCPYDTPEEYARLFRTRPLEDHLDLTRCGGWRQPGELFTPGQVRFLSDQYDASIRWVDGAMAGFVDFLESRGTLADTVLVVVSDHGEEFDEHGRVGHRATLHAESLRVPLIIVAPGLEPRVVREGVGLIDLMPTLLEILAIPDPPLMQGRSLVSLVSGGDSGGFARPLFSELDLKVHLRSVVDGEQHLIRDLESGTSQWFDWSRDATEQHGLDPSDSERGRRLEELLEEHLATLEVSEPAPEIELSPEVEESLRALGYVD